MDLWWGLHGAWQGWLATPWVLLSLLPFLITGITLAAADRADARLWSGVQHLLVGQLQAWLRRQRAVGSAADARGFEEGALVRLGGVAARHPRARSEDGEGAVVVQASTLTDTGALVGRDCRAQDFFLVLPDGTAVRVDAAEAGARDALAFAQMAVEASTTRSLLAGAGCALDQRVLPGDRVEVIGRLRRRIDPAAPSPGPRALPIVWTVSASADEPLFLLRLPRSETADLTLLHDGDWARAHPVVLTVVGLVLGFALGGSVP